MIAEAFLSHDARHGVKHARAVTEQLTDAVNRQKSAIDHIVSLPTVNDSFFRMETEQAERLISDTLHKLFQFDGQQTQALEAAKSDFQTMKKYMDQLEAMYTGPEIGITGYKSGSILKSQEEENINQTFGAINPQMKQAVDSPMEMMLKKLDEKEKSKVDSVVKTDHSKKVNKNIIVINGKVYHTSELVEHVKTDFSNAEVKQVVYNDTLYNVYISGNNMKLEPVVSLSDIKVDESGYVKVLETAVDLTGVNDLFKAVTGRDPVTGEKVTGKDRIVASINSVPFAKIAKLEKLRDINKLIDDGKKAKKAKEVKNVSKGTGNLNRKEAFNNAKDLAGVPRCQQPTRQWQVGDNINKKGGDFKNYEYSSNPTHHGRYYEYDTPQGKRVIVEHINDGRLHSHAGKPKDGANPFEYDFKKERYSNIYGLNGDHHIYYNR
ncbi:toxin YxiD [Bacillus vallismortis]